MFKPCRTKAGSLSDGNRMHGYLSIIHSPRFGLLPNKHMKK